MDSLKHVRKLLQMEPSNRQALELEKEVQKRMERGESVGARPSG